MSVPIIPRPGEGVPGNDLLRALARTLVGEILPPRGLQGAALRQATVLARDPLTQTFTIDVGGGEPSSPFRASHGFVPVVGSSAWLLQNGTDWQGLYGIQPGYSLPRGKLRSTATQTPNDTPPVKFRFDLAGGMVEDDTDNDGTATMVDRANSRIYARWPGYYAYGYHAHIILGGDITWIADVRLNGGLFLPPRFAGNSSDTGDVSQSDERYFNAGEYIELWVTGNGITFGTSSNELGMSLWMSYKP